MLHVLGRFYYHLLFVSLSVDRKLEAGGLRVHFQFYRACLVHLLIIIKKILTLTDNEGHSTGKGQRSQKMNKRLYLINYYVHIHHI